MIKPSTNFGVIDLIEYALAVAQEFEGSKPSSYREAMNNFENDLWLIAMIGKYESL